MLSKLVLKISVVLHHVWHLLAVLKLGRSNPEPGGLWSPVWCIELQHHFLTKSGGSKSITLDFERLGCL